VGGAFHDSHFPQTHRRGWSSGEHGLGLPDNTGSGWERQSVIFTGQQLSNRIAMRAVWKQGRANIVHAQDDSSTGPIVLRGVAVRYGRRTALVGVSGEFRPTSLTAVVGANGARKSTLLAALAGRARLAGGRGQLSTGGPPQRAAVNTDYPLTVREFVMLGGW
jgi:ABC-type multidrug transport system fused ATPase/permease subunit